MPVDPRIQAALDAPMNGKKALPKPKRRGKGYAASAGTGPLGESCGSCRHCHPTGSDYRTWICDALQIAYERGTFISRSMPACRRWEANR